MSRCCRHVANESFVAHTILKNTRVGRREGESESRTEGVQAPRRCPGTARTPGPHLGACGRLLPAEVETARQTVKRWPTSKNEWLRSSYSHAEEKRGYWAELMGTGIGGGRSKEEAHNLGKMRVGDAGRPKGRPAKAADIGAPCRSGNGQ